MFQRYISPPFLGLKSKPSKKPTEAANKISLPQDQSMTSLRVLSTMLGLQNFTKVATGF
jgi:hypothetical protein